MKFLTKTFGLTFILILFAFRSTIAQPPVNLSCPELIKNDIMFAYLILGAPDFKEKRAGAGIREYDIVSDQFSTKDSLFLDNMTQYWRNNSVMILDQTSDCEFVNSVLKGSDVENTLPNETIRKIFYKVGDKFMVYFLYDCGKGCIRMGGEKLPVLVINKEGDIHELMRL